MSDIERFEAALHTDDPPAHLGWLATMFAAAGDTPIAVLQRFENYRAELRRQDREEDEDQILDAMDRIVGWCGPHAAFFPTYQWPATEEGRQDAG